VATLILGPLLRYVGEDAATVWVETSAPCEVTVTATSAEGTPSTSGGNPRSAARGGTAPPAAATHKAASATFHVQGHHYALVVLHDLEPGRVYTYQVLLDGEVAWPEPSGARPPSTIRTPAPGGRTRIAFGSCRRALPHTPPWSHSRRRHRRGFGTDALVALARRLPGLPAGEWPTALLLLGDQVYADEPSPDAKAFIRSRRDPSAVLRWGVADFEEYTFLYRESWQDPDVRWLLSVVPTAMIFDDHDVHDDWNTSQAWLDMMQATTWWHERLTAGLVSYWVYQHLGNLTPDALERDELLAAVRRAPDGMGLLREFAERAEEEVAHGGIRFSYVRDLGRVRLLMIDSRAGRVVARGRRDMLDTAQWAWLDRQMTGDVDHLLLGTSVPFLLPRTLHDLEAWNEQVAEGAWGPWAARAGEVVRQAVDLEHWAAFSAGFETLAGLIEEVGAGTRGTPPASIVVLSGDVHHAYLAEVGFPAGRPVDSRVYQAVCSPFRNPVQRSVEVVSKLTASRPAAAGARALARLAGATTPGIDWRVTHGPWFENQIATLDLEGRTATLHLERAVARAGTPVLETVLEQPLTPPAGR